MTTGLYDIKNTIETDILARHREFKTSLRQNKIMQLRCHLLVMPYTTTLDNEAFSPAIERGIFRTRVLGQTGGLRSVCFARVDIRLARLVTL